MSAASRTAYDKTADYKTMATRRLLQAAGRRLGARAASDDARIVERANLNYAEAQKYDATADTLEHMCAQLPPVGPMTRTDALDAGAARKEAYEEAA